MFFTIFSLFTFRFTSEFFGTWQFLFMHSTTTFLLYNNQTLKEKIKFGTVIKEKIAGKITYSRNSWTMSISNVINLPNCNCPYDIFACMYAIDRATFFGKYHRMYRWFPYKVQLFSIQKEWQIPKLDKIQCSTNAHITYSLSTWA